MQAKLLTLCMALCAVCLSATSQNVPDYVPTDGLVAWYPFNGNANDESDVSSDGLMFSLEAAEDRFGNPNSAYYFSGSGCTPHIETNINFQGSTDGMTISFWLNRQGNGCIYPRLFGFWSGGNNPQSWGMAWSNTDVLDYMGESPVNEQWHHILVTLDADSIHAYLNGVFEGVYESSKQCPLASYMSIGRMTHPAYDAFNGYMDDFAIFNRILTEEEILALYNAEPPISGCTDSTACNFDSEATSDDGSCIPSGCMDSEACNYNAMAECEGEECDYSCCPGPGCCADGTAWDYQIAQCIPSNFCQEDLDGDGVIGVNDLMQLLSLFGTACEAEDVDPELGEFTCGDPMNYHGYDYATVLIGEQCWFAENLRNEHYANGDAIQLIPENGAWSSTSNGAMCWFNNDSVVNGQFGALYNVFAAIDDRSICPSGWNVPSATDFDVLLNSLGGSETAGIHLKSSVSDVIPWDGENSFQFNAVATGARHAASGNFVASDLTLFGSRSVFGNLAEIFRLKTDDDFSQSYNNALRDGNSVRCLKDTEE